MFTRRALYHPYKPSAPAGFRIADYVKRTRCFNLFQGLDPNTRSPAPSPVRHPQDDHPPTLRLADFFTGNGFGTPQHPSTPSPDHPRNATPHVQQTNVRVQDQIPIPPPRKRRYGPKHLSFNNGALHSVPPRRRAQQLKEKRATARKRILERHESRMVRARECIDSLRREAEGLMKPERMDEQDRIFLKQLQALQLDQVLNHDLEQCRQRMTRAADESTARSREYEERDEEAAMMWDDGQDEMAQVEQERKVEAFVRSRTRRKDEHRRRVEEEALRADEERQRVHEAQERKIREEQERLFRQQQLALKVKQEEERRKREEQERRKQERERRLWEERERRLREQRERQLLEERQRELREERERRLREEVARVRREAHEQLLREEKARLLREEVERLRREAYEQSLREERERLAREEQERQAYLLAEQARRATQEDQIRQRFVVYDSKWNELRTNSSLPLIDVREMPWPVFGDVISAHHITSQDVRSFLFHPQRPGVEGKTARDKVKAEVLRFHPDKFNARILPKIQPSQRAVAEEIAGAVARILTTIMTEDVEEQK